MTVQDVLDRAFARSRRFVPEGVGMTASPAELVPAVQDSLYALFQIAARVNPAFYGASRTVAYDAVAGGWPRPSDAESIERIERATGEEVVVVPIDQQDAEEAFPSVYRWGRIYKPAAVATGPDAGEALTFYFSRVPDALVDEDSDIDSAFPESNSTLLELDVAIRLAIKDGGATAAETLQPLVSERAAALRRYVAFLEHETVGVRWRDGPPGRTASLAALESLLAGIG